MTTQEKDDTLEGAATGSPAGDEAVDQATEEAIEAEVIEEQAEVQEDTPNLFDAIKAEVTELRDRYARLQAEWDNYRKRTQAEREQERIRASEKLVMDLLPVLDDLERAIAHAKETGEGGTLTDGVEAIQNKFLQILEKHKVTQIPAMGEPFDAMVYQAVGTEEDPSVPEETVVKVFQQGYRMGDRVIRPAMVVTSTGGPAREPDGANE